MTSQDWWWWHSYPRWYVFHFEDAFLPVHAAPHTGSSRSKKNMKTVDICRETLTWNYSRWSDRRTWNVLAVFDLAEKKYSYILVCLFQRLAVHETRMSTAAEAVKLVLIRPISLVYLPKIIRTHFLPLMRDGSRVIMWNNQSVND